MDAYISRRKRPRLSGQPAASASALPPCPIPQAEQEESTDVKLAIISSLHPSRPQGDLLELLLDCDGSVEQVLAVLSTEPPDASSSPRKRRTVLRKGKMEIGLEI